MLPCYLPFSFPRRIFPAPAPCPFPFSLPSNNIRHGCGKIKRYFITSCASSCCLCFLLWFRGKSCGAAAGVSPWIRAGYDVFLRVICALARLVFFGVFCGGLCFVLRGAVFRESPGIRAGRERVSAFRLRFPRYFAPLLPYFAALNGGFALKAVFMRSARLLGGDVFLYSPRP